MLRRINVYALAVAVAFAFLLTNCGPKVVAISGEALATLGQQYNETKIRFNDLLDSGKITRESYDEFKAFGLEWEEYYPQAVAAWNNFAKCEIAKQDNPDLECGDLPAIVQQVVDLKNQLLDFYYYAKGRS